MKALIKRWGLFLTVNFLVLIVLGFILSLFGISADQWTSLLLYCAVFGFAGSFISLLASKSAAKASYKIQPLTRETASGKELYLYDAIENMSRERGISMPEFGIYQSPDANAFATGASKNKSLIAFSSGIVQNLEENELAAVAGHEMTHITEGDMVTTTLLMGTVNTFVLFLSNIIAAVLSGRRRGSDDDSGRGSVINSASQSAVAMMIQSVLMVLANIALSAHSRHREFIADAGAARLTNPADMITALQKISGNYVPSRHKDAFGMAKISNFSPLSLFSTHPPIEKRIERLRQIMA